MDNKKRVIQLAFRNTEYNKPPKTIIDRLGHLQSKAVAWFTKGPFSHVEIVYTNDDGKLMMMSSVNYNDDKKTSPGVREKEHKYNERLYTYIDVEVSNFERGYQFFKLIENEGYDMVGIILSQIIPFGIDRTNKWFCSEFASKFLLIAGTSYEELWLRKTENIHPNMLFKIVGEK